MAFGRTLLVGVTGASLVALIAVPAHAGLLGSGKTVQATFTSYTLGLAAGPQVSPYSALTPVNPANVIEPQPLTTPQQFTEAGSDTKLTVNDTQLSIESLLSPPAPFCFSTNASGTSCPDPQATVTFLFTGENIISATIDPASAAIFLAPTNPLQGITFGPNEISVDVVGANPPASSTLIVDVVTGAPTVTPEPASIATLGVALSAMFVARRRRKRG